MKARSPVTLLPVFIDPELTERIVASTGLSPAEAARVIEDVLAFHAETVERLRPAPARPPEDLRREERRDLRPDRRRAGRPRGRRPGAHRAAAAPARVRMRGTHHMCGIVGYVGGQQAAPDPGRGPDPARAPRLRLGRRGRARRQRRQGRQAGRAGARPRRTRCPSGSPARSASATPAGPPTARPTTSTPIPHTDAAGAGRRRPQRDHRQRRGAAAAADRPGRRAGVRHRHRGDRPPGRAPPPPTPSRARSATRWPRSRAPTGSP